MRLLYPFRQQRAAFGLVSGNRADGLAPGRLFQDELLHRLVGSWEMKGLVRGRAMACRMRGKWVLNHQFLRLNVRHRSYDATVYIGYDRVSERYVAHWLDVMGGRIAETLGFGQRVGTGLHFVFEYPAGPSHTSLTFNAGANTWGLLITDRQSDGGSSEFAQFAIRPRRRVARRRAPPRIVIREEQDLAG